MQKYLKKILHILDGTPAEYGLRSRGQSVAELALVTPILIVLIMGLVEIGWFANNYLILLEATRTGARFGTVQTGLNSPLSWNNDASLVPNQIKKDFFPLDPATENLRIGVRTCSEVTRDQRFQGFYSLLNCVVQQSMNPLTMHIHDEDSDPQYPDDIVISVFALQLVDPREPFWNRNNQHQPAKTNKQLLAQVPGIDSEMPRVVVVGRYPTNANECTVDADDPTKGRAWEDRDPFDYIQNGVRDYVLIDPGLAPDPNIEDNRIYLELFGADPYSATDASKFERQRGFVYVGQHHIAGATEPNANCIGSEWTIAEVEELINLPTYGLDDATERSKLASMGLVLVELYWQHDLLLKNPVFNPVFTILGPNTTIAVWSAFPVPAVEPRIRFPK
ncbi:MAG: pilus assembly protein [Chloroflexi bacterium]|nr:pilus assembly protein [Chloroflexota bacterium]